MSEVDYGRQTRLRIAVSEIAAEIANDAMGLVPTGADRYGQPGEMVAIAASLADDARRLLQLAVAYERQRTSWEEIGDRLGISRQAAHERYAAVLARIDEAVTETWLTSGYHPQLPSAAANPAKGLEELDLWAVRHLPGEQDERPVSEGLAPMTTTEHASMVVASGALVAQRRQERTGTADELARLEAAHARRKVQLYERMLAEETAQPGSTGTDIDQLRDLLTGARANLADAREHGTDTHQ